MDLEGVYTPIVTAFDERGDLDQEATAAVIEFVLAGGIRGLVPCGTTGEYYACSTEERMRILEHTRDVNAGRAQLVAGCNAGATRDAIGYAEKARELGYDAIMLAAPYTSLPTQRELAAHFEAIATAAGLPVILYNYPARAGVEIGFDCLDAIVDRPEIVGIKESSGDFSRFLALRRRYADRITVMCGSDDQAVDYFSWGVRSWLAGTSNVLPRHHAAIMDAANSGDHATAYRLFDGILAWVQLMEAGSYNQKAKLGLAHQGLPTGDVRQPLLPLEAADAAELIAALDAALAVSLAPA
jgi:4-hydroxy-tetrahydrodipicolinate synthase